MTGTRTRTRVRVSKVPSDAAVSELTAQLEAHASATRAAEVKRYLKSELSFLGVTVPALRREAEAFVRAHAPLTRSELMPLTAALWQGEVYELRAVSVAILELEQQHLRGSDLPALIALIRQAKTWALVDWLSTKVMGPIITRQPATRKHLDRWARDQDFWVRRTALLCFHDPLLAGAGDFDHFARLATPMLGEREFFIRKAIGWVLRSTAKRSPERTYAYVAAHAGEMSGLTFKEATRNLKPKQIAALSALRAKQLTASSRA
jgi:3-methyladenine DNA glycosylase AlkD